MTSSNTLIPQKYILLLAVVYCCFVVYGSLIPFDFHDRPFQDALAAFKNIRYLDLGMGSRADWIANILLYIPLSFLLLSCFRFNTAAIFLKILTSLAVFGFCLALAVGVEFTQEYFPQRTVSLNDLIAETLGAVLGILLRTVFSRSLLTLSKRLAVGGKQAIFGAFLIYALAYLALSFFPFDFVASFDELAIKWESDSNALWIAPSCGGALRCSTKLTSEILLTLPIGLFLAYFFKNQLHSVTPAVILGFLASVFIEGTQIFLISGIAQGLSVVTRTLGVMLGALAYKKHWAATVYINPKHLRQLIALGIVPYLLLLFALNTGSWAEMLSFEGALAKLDAVHWTPFYYHYFTQEAVAFNSLLSVSLMYAPIGVGCWLWVVPKQADTSVQKLVLMGAVSAVLAVVVEAGKLFFEGWHPDPTNVLVVLVVVPSVYLVAAYLFKWQQDSVNPAVPVADFARAEAGSVSATTNALPPTPAESAVTPPFDSTRSHWLMRAAAVMALGFVVIKALDYPVHAPLFVGFLSGYALIMWRYPKHWLVMLLALLPVFDFATVSGRFFFADIDYLVFITIAVMAWKGNYQNPFKNLKPVAGLLLGVFFMLVFISFIIGLLPLQPLGLNAFSHYYSHYNSLRVGKGFFEAAALWPLIAYTARCGVDVRMQLAYGLLLGLLGVCGAAVYERLLFTGLFDYTSDYRITATFSSMHTGGAPLDTFLMLSIPFIMVLFYPHPHRAARAGAGVALLIGSIYVLLMTYSRAPYIGFVVELLVLSAGLLVAFKRDWRFMAALPVVLALVYAIAKPVMRGGFIQQRFAQAAAEVDVRRNHWADAIDMMDNSAMTALFGMGLGSFPRNYFWSHVTDGQPPASYRFGEENGVPFLRLTAGTGLYVEQVVAIVPHTDYVFSAMVRGATPTAQLGFSLCEKQLQNVARCVVQTVAVQPDNWRSITFTFNSAEVGLPLANLGVRPTKLSLYNGNAASWLDIKAVSLRTATGGEFVKNGAFAAGLDNWFFSADQLISWRTENLAVELLFTQGGLGVSAFALLMLVAVKRQLTQLKCGDGYAAAVLAAWAGFAVVGLVGSPFDVPTITLVFFAGVFTGLLTDALPVKNERNFNDN
jgi:glycopeptide antibiotics resistance protein